MSGLQRVEIVFFTRVGVGSLVATMALVGVGCPTRSSGVLPAEYVIQGRVCSGSKLAVSSRGSADDTPCASPVRDAAVWILLGESSEPSLATRTDARGGFLLAFSMQNSDPFVLQVDAQEHAALSLTIKGASDLRAFAVGPARYWMLVELESYSAIAGGEARR
jgi:hypothetical protein